MSFDKNFELSRKEQIKKIREDGLLKNKAVELTSILAERKYIYNFDWLGVPIFAQPQDILAIQEIVWRSKPNIIIETGVARGGSVILSASLLDLVNKPQGQDYLVIGVDIDIRNHAKQAIKNHIFSKNILLIEGDSVSLKTLRKVAGKIKPHDKVMVILDSNHTHDHVLKELNLYSPYVSELCYLVVMDTSIEDVPEDFSNRPWGVGNNPKTAVKEFMLQNKNFVIDDELDSKLVITSAPGGFLKRLRK